MTMLAPVRVVPDDFSKCSSLIPMDIISKRRDTKL